MTAHHHRPPLRTCFFVSDHTGVSAEVLGKALLAQFGDVVLRKLTLPFVNSHDKLAGVLETLAATARRDGVRPIVFSTLINPELRQALQGAEALVMDFFGPFIGRLEVELEQHSALRVGGAHTVGEAYPRRINAVNFALQTDDGLQSEHYAEADVILIGVSRSGKTPTCLYLALHYGTRAANYPLTEDDLGLGRLPEVLEPHQSRLCGLLIDPVRLHQIRSERRPDSRYSALDTCRREVARMRALVEHHRLPRVDTSAASIEEIAANVMQQAKLARQSM